MSKRKAQQQSKQPASPQQKPAASLLTVLVTAFSGALLVARLVVPTEAAPQGATLWLTQFWMFTGLLWVWDRFRQSDYKLYWDWFDIGLLLLVLGHVLSAIKVFIMLEQRRAALNLTWEWIGLGISVLLMRSLLKKSVSMRSVFLLYLMAATALAGLGFWQHYVFYPETAQEYRLLRNRLDENPADLAAQQQLLDMGVPPDALAPPARRMWEQRLEGSTEPFGGFALANSFAAVLLLGTLIAGTSLIIIRNSNENTLVQAVTTLCLAMTAYCLVLTKSRTAWVGLIAGVLFWFSLFIWRWLIDRNGKTDRAEESIEKQQSNWLATGVIAVGVLLLSVLIAGAAAFSGSLDQAVLVEAPKSLLYRLQYWQATWQVIQEQPLFGTGPGNFRQHYLQFKLPESSEEIADPHNFLLDLWANGGLLSVIGLGLLILLAIKHFCSSWYQKPANGQNPADSDANKLFLTGSACGFLFVLMSELLTGPVMPDRILQLMMMALFGFTLLQLLSRGQAQSAQRKWQPLTALSVIVALFVHLTGAGGVEMPAIAQLLLVFMAIICTAVSQPTQARSVESNSIAAFAIMAILLVALNIGCLLTGLLPVFHVQSLLQSGDIAFATGHVAAAERAYQQASEADRLNPEPLMKRAQLHWWKTEQEMAKGRFDQAEFEAAISFALQAITRDPYSPNNYRMLGDWYYKIAQAMRNRNDNQHKKMATEAVERYGQAVKLYPNYAVVQAEAALAAQLADQHKLADEYALRALELDKINQQAGHLDKLLTEELHTQMKHIAGTTKTD